MSLKSQVHSWFSTDSEEFNSEEVSLILFCKNFSTSSFRTSKTLDVCSFDTTGSFAVEKPGIEISASISNGKGRSLSLSH